MNTELVFDELIKIAAQEYMKEEYKKVKTEMQNLDPIFIIKAEENNSRFYKLLNTRCR